MPAELQGVVGRKRGKGGGGGEGGRKIQAGAGSGSATARTPSIRLCCLHGGCPCLIKKDHLEQDLVLTTANLKLDGICVDPPFTARAHTCAVLPISGLATVTSVMADL
eukprot:358531-Chlamydomonas_euryale.AAC.5